VSTLLKNLKIRTIGSVDRPANQPALVELCKRYDLPEGGEENIEIAKASDLLEITQELEKAGKKISKENLDILMQAHKLLMDMISRAGGEMNMEKKKEDDTLENLEKAMPKEDFMKMKPDEMYAAYEKACTNMKKSAEAPVIKMEDLPEPIRKMMETQQAEKEVLEKRLKDTEELAKKMADEKARETYIAKAAGFQNLAVKPDEFGLVLKSAAENMTAEDFASLEGVLKAADEAIKQGNLFKEFGRSGHGAAVNSVMAKAEAMAAEMVQKSTAMTKEMALAKVWEENPDLYEQYESERGVK